MHLSPVAIGICSRLRVEGDSADREALGRQSLAEQVASANVGLESLQLERKGLGVML